MHRSTSSPTTSHAARAVCADANNGAKHLRRILARLKDEARQGDDQQGEQRGARGFGCETHDALARRLEAAATLAAAAAAALAAAAASSRTTTTPSSTRSLLMVRVAKQPQLHGRQVLGRLVQRAVDLALRSGRVRREAQAAGGGDGAGAWLSGGGRQDGRWRRRGHVAGSTTAALAAAAERAAAAADAAAGRYSRARRCCCRRCCCRRG